MGLKAILPGDICYFWPGSSSVTITEAKERGGRIVLEFINTHMTFAKRILDEECERVGAPVYAHFADGKSEEEEEARIKLSDAIFAPGPFVERSIHEYSKFRPSILNTSYGSCLPAGHPLPEKVRPAAKRLRFLFVGTASVRKGVHTLIEAWRRCALPAELIIAGQVEPYIEHANLKSPVENISYRGFVHDISSLYREADVFVFPSLEEGGPQVTYEAAAHGLPLIMTPMGGGRIAVDRHNALLVDPSNIDALSSALIEIFEDHDLRTELGRAASHDAANYDWHLVAARRHAALCALPDN